MQRKNYFPPEADTQPDVLRAKLVARASVKATKGAASNRRDPGLEGAQVVAKAPERAAASANRQQSRTEPPRRPDNVSGVRPRRPSSDTPAACVDEVVADLSHDPRREPD